MLAIGVPACPGAGGGGKTASRHSPLMWKGKPMHLPIIALTALALAAAIPAARADVIVVNNAGSSVRYTVSALNGANQQQRLATGCLVNFNRFRHVAGAGMLGGTNSVIWVTGELMANPDCSGPVRSSVPQGVGLRMDSPHLTVTFTARGGALQSAATR
ncbi:hypothetical protein EJV46_14670 [Roseococcus sp. SYP-B2431]|uniref:hypothetical protein n=1 Tax=Roseococcus sp. SYP-B2431 TaxID=2496640 RepID=UPI00103F3365|nr:hypothetical protein [Roseococcus sp. SYP-B2431]TCH97378.1 hypothetical protein EJV46_14670 [Roseococcus sp. SYP-B2431]